MNINAPLKCPNEIASIVIDHLPDSQKIARSLLTDLLVIIDDDHPLRGEVVARLRRMEHDAETQPTLALRFRALAQAAL